MGEDDQAAMNNAASDANSDNVLPEQIVNRRNRWVSSLAALHYINKVSKDKEVFTRDSDRVTAIALIVACVAALACLFVPQIEHYRRSCVLVADSVMGLALLSYVVNRFGIVTTFQPRQALLTWQLMIGTGLIGVFISINLALFIAELISTTDLSFLFHR
jgi:cyanate permease